MGSESSTSTLQSNTKHGGWIDSEDCNCSSSQRKVLSVKIVRSPLLSAISSYSVSGVRLVSNLVTFGFAEKWIGTDSVPMEHQAIEVSVYCINCNQSTIYTFEYLGGIGKLDRSGYYKNRYQTYLKQRKIENQKLFLSDIYELHYNLPGKWKSKHYDSIKNNCQRYAQLMWNQLFGYNTDDYGEWISQLNLKCNCNINHILIKKIELIRVQTNTDLHEISTNMFRNTVNLLTLGATNSISHRNDNKVFYAIQLYCKCNICANKCYYTIQNSKKGKCFRCGKYNKKLKSLRIIQKRKSFTIKMVHSLFKSDEFTDFTINNKKWTLSFWDNMFLNK